jgi:hypothetical protein
MGNIGEYAGGGNITGQGRCGDGLFTGLLPLTCKWLSYYITLLKKLF